MSCVSASNLTANLLDQCRPLGQGLYETMYVGQIKDILAVTYDNTNPLLVTGFTLKTGAKLKVWGGLKLSSQTTVSFTANDSGNKLPHGFRFTNHDTTTAGKAEMNKALKVIDLFVAAKQQGLNGEWELFGFSTGMAATGVTRDSNDANNPGQYVAEFSAPLETDLPFTLKHVTSSVDDTETFLQGLALAVS